MINEDIHDALQSRTLNVRNSCEESTPWVRHWTHQWIAWNNDFFCTVTETRRTTYIWAIQSYHEWPYTLTMSKCLEKAQERHIWVPTFCSFLGFSRGTEIRTTVMQPHPKTTAFQYRLSLLLWEMEDFVQLACIGGLDTQENIPQRFERLVWMFSASINPRNIS